MTTIFIITIRKLDLLGIWTVKEYQISKCVVFKAMLWLKSGRFKWFVQNVTVKHPETRHSSLVLEPLQKCSRYADDTTSSCSGKNLEEIIKNLKHDADAILKYMSRNW